MVSSTAIIHERGRGEVRLSASSSSKEERRTGKGRTWSVVRAEDLKRDSAALPVVRKFSSKALIGACDQKLIIQNALRTTEEQNVRWPEEDSKIFVEVGEMFGDGLCKMHASAMEHFSGTIKGSTEALKRNENAYLVRVEADGTMEWIAAEANSDATARRLEGMKRRFEENNPPFIEVPSRRIGEVKKIKSIKTKEKAPIAGSRFALLNSVKQRNDHLESRPAARREECRQRPKRSALKGARKKEEKARESTPGGQDAASAEIGVSIPGVSVPPIRRPRRQRESRNRWEMPPKRPDLPTTPTSPPTEEEIYLSRIKEDIQNELITIDDHGNIVVDDDSLIIDDDDVPVAPDGSLQVASMALDDDELLKKKCESVAVRLGEGIPGADSEICVPCGDVVPQRCLFVAQYKPTEVISADGVFSATADGGATVTLLSKKLAKDAGMEGRLGNITVRVVTVGGVVRTATGGNSMEIQALCEAPCCEGNSWGSFMLENVFVWDDPDITENLLSPHGVTTPRVQMDHVTSWDGRSWFQQGEHRFYLKNTANTLSLEFSVTGRVEGPVGVPGQQSRALWNQKLHFQKDLFKDLQIPEFRSGQGPTKSRELVLEEQLRMSEQEVDEQRQRLESLVEQLGDAQRLVEHQKEARQLATARVDELVSQAGEAKASAESQAMANCSFWAELAYK